MSVVSLVAARGDARAETRSGWDVEVLADSDTRWKWGAHMARRLTTGARPRLHGTLLLGRSTPTSRQLRDVGVAAESLRRATLRDAVARLADTYAEVVVLACVGGTVQALLQALAHAWAGRPTRPVVVTGYVGLVYENAVDGLLLRAGADVVLANSAVDAERFRAAYVAVGVDPASIVRTALPFLGGTDHDPHAAGRDRPFTLTFVTQPGVPATRAQRRYSLQQAVTHATRHPERCVIVKLRGRVGERTTHVEPHHYESLVPAAGLPANVEMVYGPMSPVLDRTDLCVTVSSTAALEAMHRGIPTGILTDFGIRESLGNPLFLGSGAYTSWPALHDGARPATDADWAARNGVRDPDPYRLAARRVTELVDARPSLAALRPWLDPVDTAGYLPDLLAGHGLDLDGAPLRSPSGARASLPRRALRAAARRAYGLGSRVLEPRLKRLAQL